MFITVGAVVLTVGLVRVTRFGYAVRAIRDWWINRRQPMPPSPAVGLPPDRNPTFLEGSEVQAAVERMAAGTPEQITIAFSDFVPAVRALDEAPAGTGAQQGR